MTKPSRPAVLSIRNARLADVNAISALVAKVYKDMPAYTPGMLRGQIAAWAGAPERRRLTRLTNWSGRNGLVMKSAAPSLTARLTSRSHRDAVNISTGVSR